MGLTTSKGEREDEREGGRRAIDEQEVLGGAVRMTEGASWIKWNNLGHLLTSDWNMWTEETIPYANAGAIFDPMMSCESSNL